MCTLNGICVLTWPDHSCLMEGQSHSYYYCAQAVELSASASVAHSNLAYVLMRTPSDSSRQLAVLHFLAAWVPSAAKINSCHSAINCAKLLLSTNWSSAEPWCRCRWLRFTRPFLLGSCVLSDLPPAFLCLITWRGVGCRYRCGLGQILKRAQLLNITAYGPSIWAMGYTG